MGARSAGIEQGQASAAAAAETEEEEERGLKLRTRTERWFMVQMKDKTDGFPRNGLGPAPTIPFSLSLSLSHSLAKHSLPCICFFVLLKCRHQWALLGPERGIPRTNALGRLSGSKLLYMLTDTYTYPHPHTLAPITIPCACVPMCLCV